MSVPHTFFPNTTISSSQVNANFDYILGTIIGAVIGDDAQFMKDFVFGSRQNHVLGGAHDTTAGSSTRRFTMLSFNAKYKLNSGEWKWLRIKDGENATVAKVGSEGFRVATTSRTTGSLDSQIRDVFAIRATTGKNADYMFLPRGWNFQAVDGNINTVEDYRLTLCMLENPVDLIATTIKRKSQGTWVIDMRQNGASDFSKGSLIVIEGTAGSGVRANCRVYMERGTRIKSYGVSLYADPGKSDQAQGVVLHGRNPNEGKVVVEIDNQWASLSIYLLGYYI